MSSPNSRYDNVVFDMDAWHVYLEPTIRVVRTSSPEKRFANRYFMPCLFVLAYCQSKSGGPMRPEDIMPVLKTPPAKFLKTFHDWWLSARRHRPSEPGTNFVVKAEQNASPVESNTDSEVWSTLTPEERTLLMESFLPTPIEGLVIRDRYYRLGANSFEFRGSRGPDYIDWDELERTASEMLHEPKPHLTADDSPPEHVFDLHEGDTVDTAGLIGAIESLMTETSGTAREDLLRLSELLLKTDRTTFLDDPSSYLLKLDKAKLYWQEQIRKKSEDRPGRGRSLPLYELGQVHFLLGDHETASRRYADSLESALRTIRRGFEEDSEYREDACTYLSHIWVRQLCLDQAESQGWLLRRLRGQTEGEGKFSVRADRCRRIHDCLSAITALVEPGSYGLMQLQRLLEQGLRIIDAQWDVPYDKLDVTESELKAMSRGLGRKRFSAWLHAIRQSAWPKLYGVGDQGDALRFEYIHNNYESPGWNPRMGKENGKYFLVWRFYSILLAWSRGSDLDDVGSTMSFLWERVRHAVPVDIYVDVLLLTWHLADDNVSREALLSYLRNQMPPTGQSAIAQLAIQKMMGSV